MKNILLITLILIVSSLLFPVKKSIIQHSEPLLEGDYYSLAYSSKFNKLFYYTYLKKSGSSIKSIDLSNNTVSTIYHTSDKGRPVNTKTDQLYDDFSNNPYQTIITKKYNNIFFKFFNKYQKNKPELIFNKISEYILLDTKSNKLYFIDRTRSLLATYSLINNYISDFLYSTGFKFGDSPMVFDQNNNLFILNESRSNLYKINLLTNDLLIKKNLKLGGFYFHRSITYNPSKKVFYINNWLSKDNKYFIWEIDANTLEVKRKLSVPAQAFELLSIENGQHLLAVLPICPNFKSFIYIIDPNKLKIVNKIRVPVGSRALAYDPERKIIFTGSALTNLVCSIDFRNKKILKYYRAGRLSLRSILLDTENKLFYVSTQCNGLYRGKY